MALVKQGVSLLSLHKMKFWITLNCGFPPFLCPQDPELSQARSQRGATLFDFSQEFIKIWIHKSIFYKDSDSQSQWFTMSQINKVMDSQSHRFTKSRDHKVIGSQSHEGPFLHLTWKCNVLCVACWVVVFSLQLIVARHLDYVLQTTEVL